MSQPTKKFPAGIENDPVLSTDTEVSWSRSGSCDDGSDTTCISEMSLGGDEDDFPGRVPVHVNRGGRSISEMTFTFNDDGDDVPDRIQVYGKRPPEPRIVIHCISCGDSFNDVDTGTMRMIDRFPFEESTEAEACDTEDFGDLLDDFLTSDEQAMVADFLNSQDARDLWTAGNFIPYLYFSIRGEQGGLLMPDGGSWDFFWGADLDNNACRAFFGIPGEGDRPPRSILVHTHPWRNGENQEICNDYSQPVIYENTPGWGDTNALAGQGLEVGLILDADGFIIHGPDGEYVFVEGECGFTRL